MLEILNNKVGGFYSISNNSGLIIKAFVLGYKDIEISSKQYNIDYDNVLYIGEFYFNSIVLVDEHNDFFYLIEDDFYKKKTEHSVCYVLLSDLKNKKLNNCKLRLNTISDIIFLECKCLMIEF